MATERYLGSSRKISETFIEFVSPIVAVLNEAAGKTGQDTALKLGSIVWNAVVYADAMVDHTFLDRVRRDMARDPISTTFVNQLIERKRTLFASDHRLVASYGFRQRQGEPRFWVKAPRPLLDLPAAIRLGCPGPWTCGDGKTDAEIRLQ